MSRRYKNIHVKFFGTKLPIKFQNWGKNTLHSLFFEFLTHHPLSHYHHIKENKYISLPHVLVRDELVEDDASKSQKINSARHFCPSFEIQWEVLIQKTLCGNFYPFVTITWKFLHFNP